MKKRITGLVAGVLSGVMVFTGCSGASSKDESKSVSSSEAGYTIDADKPAWQQDTKDVELTWYVNADWWNTDWGKDVVTKQMQKDLHLNVKFITGDDTNLNTYFAGGDIPDILTIFDANSKVASSAPSWAYSLNDLADEYDPYFYKVASKDTLNWYTLEDGESYGYPSYSNSQNDYDKGLIKAATAFTIRKDVYEALGEPKMGTPEEFLNVLGQIKTEFPDLIPFGFNSMTTSTGSLGADFQNFIGVPIETEKGEFYNRNLDKDYLTWIDTFNKAYKNGLISDDSFSDDGTAHEEKIKVGKYACVMIGGTPQRSGPLQVFMNSNPEAQYIAIDGPQSTVGNKPTLSQSGLSGWTINYISKNCKNPAKAIQVFTYLLSDYGEILTTYGIEGETFEITADGKYQLLDAATEMKANNNDQFKKEYRLGEFCLFGHDRYGALGDRTESIMQMQDWGDGKLKTQFVIENTNPDAGSAEARSLTAIDTNWNTTLVSLIRSKDSDAFDQTLSAYKQFLADNSWDDIVAVRNEKMENNRKKLGLDK